MKIGTAFPSKWLKAEDLGGKSHTLVIEGVSLEDIGDDGEKPVIHFVGKKKACVLNRTNALAISARYGDDTDEWTDKEVVVFPDTTMFSGKMVACIRIKPPMPTAADADAESIPF